MNTPPNEGQKYDLIADEFAALRNDFSTEKKYLDLLKNYLKPGSEILDLGLVTALENLSKLDQTYPI